MYGGSDFRVQVRYSYSVYGSDPEPVFTLFLKKGQLKQLKKPSLFTTVFIVSYDNKNNFDSWTFTNKKSTVFH